MTDTTPLDPAQPIVQTKASWPAEWRPDPYIVPISAELVCAPSIDAATFTYSYGTISREGRANVLNYGPSDLLGHFIRICRRPTADEAADENFELTAVWRGLVVSAPTVIGGTSPTDLGDQTFAAVGLGELLGRTQLDRSFCQVTAGGSVIEIDDVLPFNMADAARGLQGNRSTAKVGGTYVFSDDGELWTSENILEYILERFRPGGMDWSVIGSTANLGNITPVIARPGQKTAAGVIARAIDRRRGHSWGVSPTTDDPAIRVDSILPEAIEVGGTTYTANSEPVILDADSSVVLGNPRVLESDLHRYDQLVARGGPIVVCFSTTLADAWTAAQATAYKAAASGMAGYAALGDADKRKENDDYRRSDTFADVYRLYKATAFNIGGACRSDGSIDWTQSVTAPLNGRSFLKRLPLQAGIDYSAATPAATSAGRFLSPAVFANATIEAETRMYRLDVSRADGGHGFGLRVMRGYPAVRITGGGINHVLAYGDFAAAEPSDYAATVAGGSAEFLIAIASPEHLTVTKNLSSWAEGATPRRLIIDVPGAECWYLKPQSVIGVDVDGNQVKALGGELRNDRDSLRIVAALAAAWYGRARRAIELRWREPIYDFRPGSLVTSITAQAKAVMCNSIVTRIACNFSDLTTDLVTDYVELDVVSLAGLRGARPAALGIRRITAPPAGGPGKKALDAAAEPGGEDEVRAGAPGRKFRSGVAQIDSNDGSGDYTITERIWDGDGSVWADDAAPALVAASAREVSGAENIGADKDVCFFQLLDDEGSIKNWIFRLPDDLLEDRIGMAQATALYFDIQAAKGWTDCETTRDWLSNIVWGFAAFEAGGTIGTDPAQDEVQHNNWADGLQTQTYYVHGTFSRATANLVEIHASGAPHNLADFDLRPDAAGNLEYQVTNYKARMSVVVFLFASGPLDEVTQIVAT